MTKQPGLQQYCQPGPQLRARQKPRQACVWGPPGTTAKRSFISCVQGLQLRAWVSPLEGGPLSATVCARVSGLQALGAEAPFPI